MTIKNPKGVGRALVRVKSVQLPGKVEIKEVPVEVIKEVPVSNITAEVRANEAESRLAEALKTIERMKATPKPEGPPQSVAELLREGEAFGDAASRIAKEMSDIDNKRFLKVITPDDERKYEKLRAAMNWFETRGAIEVV